METQLTFFPTGPASLDNRLLFLALVPDERTAGIFYRHGEDLQFLHHLPGRLRPQKHLHVTLQELGGWSEQTIRAASRACEATARLVTPVEVHLDRRMHWSSSSAYVLTEGSRRNQSLRELRKRLGWELVRERGPKAFDPSFTPHVTLLYGNRAIPEVAVPAALWIAREIHLVCSHQGHRKYDWIGRWPLLGEPR